VIYPQGIWYGRVSLADVPRILDLTIQGGEVLADLLLDDECLNTKGLIRPSGMAASRLAERPSND
jgi:(2Fe-2S) ferredoxin